MSYPLTYVIIVSLSKEVLIMSRKKQHSKQFKLDAVQYRKEHPDLSQIECAKNLGIGTSTLSRWESQYRDNSGDIPTRGSGNYSSDEQKEIARLKRELRDAQDALDVLKKAISILGNDWQKPVYTEVSAKVEAAKAAHRRVSISGMLKFLGVSRSGYHAFLHRTVSVSRQRKESVKQLIQQIYDKSNQNYGAPKITRELRKSGIRIAERTVGIYMKQMGIKAQWVKPWTATTRNSDFSSQLTTSLTNSLTRNLLILSGVQTLLISGLMKALSTWQASWTCTQEKSLHGHSPIPWKYPASLIP